MQLCMANEAYACERQDVHTRPIEKPLLVLKLGAAGAVPISVPRWGLRRVGPVGHQLSSPTGAILSSRVRTSLPRAESRQARDL